METAQALEQEILAERMEQEQVEKRSRTVAYFLPDHIKN